MKLAIVQTKPRKGAFAENLAALGEAFAQLAAEERPYELVVLPEAALTGYFLEGAVYESARSAESFAGELAALWRTHGEGPLDMVCGFYENAGGTYYNSALYLRIEAQRHEIVHLHRKLFLPTYGVFDEQRFLSRGRRLGVFATPFGRAALLICEDAWHGITATLAAIKGARLLIVPSASPGRGLGPGEQLESVRNWRRTLEGYALEHGVFVIYAGLAGFEGGKGMTGSSCAIDPQGRVLVEAPALGACIVRADLDLAEIEIARARLPLLGDLQAVLPDLLLDRELLPYLDLHAERGA
ncbi:MAG: nitrilase-related carbon-nitrogen hydrolase [Vulcanimicrobiaceae bacterium]